MRCRSARQGCVISLVRSSAGGPCVTERRGPRYRTEERMQPCLTHLHLISLVQHARHELGDYGAEDVIPSVVERLSAGHDDRFGPQPREARTVAVAAGTGRGLS